MVLLEIETGEDPTVTIGASTRKVRDVFLAMAIVLVPSQVLAYVGPGAGLSIIGSLLAFIAVIFVGIFGFLWFPIRRLLRKRKQSSAQSSEDSNLKPAEVAADTSHTHEAERDESEA